MIPFLSKAHTYHGRLGFIFTNVTVVSIFMAFNRRMDSCEVFMRCTTKIWEARQSCSQRSCAGVTYRKLPGLAMAMALCTDTTSEDGSRWDAKGAGTYDALAHEIREWWWTKGRNRLSTQSSTRSRLYLLDRYATLRHRLSLGEIGGGGVCALMADAESQLLIGTSIVSFFLFLLLESLLARDSQP